jgi:nucleotide-binding universal stress UspA family protein
MMIALKRILVPFDFDQTSAPAAVYAADLAKKFGSELAFVYVGDRARGEYDVEQRVEGSAAMADGLRESVLKVLSPADHASLNPQYFVRAGVPAAEIVRLAQEHEFDLIVMGTHGRGLVGHMVMGSVAEKVVRTAPCPVLTVRNPVQAGHEVVLIQEAVTVAPAAV